MVMEEEVGVVTVAVAWTNGDDEARSTATSEDGLDAWGGLRVSGSKVIEEVSVAVLCGPRSVNSCGLGALGCLK